MESLDFQLQKLYVVFNNFLKLQVDQRLTIFWERGGKRGERSHLGAFDRVELAEREVDDALCYAARICKPSSFSVLESI
jgi:hypothetical protein